MSQSMGRASPAASGIRSARWLRALLCVLPLAARLPDQEAALRDPAGQQLYARGVFEGIVAYLKSVTRATAPAGSASGR